jgi:hypothetical protein
MALCVVLGEPSRRNSSVCLPCGRSKAQGATQTFFQLVMAIVEPFEPAPNADPVCKLTSTSGFVPSMTTRALGGSSARAVVVVVSDAPRKDTATRETIAEDAREDAREDDAAADEAGAMRAGITG